MAAMTPMMGLFLRCLAALLLLVVLLVFLTDAALAATPFEMAHNAPWADTPRT